SIPADTTKTKYGSLLRDWRLPWDWRSGVLTRHDPNQPAGPSSTQSCAAGSAARSNSAGGLFRGGVAGRLRRPLLQLAFYQPTDHRSAPTHPEADRRESQARTIEGASG